MQLRGHDELAVLSSEFNALTERLQTSEQHRRQFVSDASHELKTPLTSIKLLSDSILQNDMDTGTIREFVEDIGNEADRLTRMSQKLLSLTKMDAGKEAEPGGGGYRGNHRPCAAYAGAGGTPQRDVLWKTVPALGPPF